MQDRIAETRASARRVPLDGSRIIAIDIARGFAICWVVLYHLWTDLRYPNVYPTQGDAFRAVTTRLGAGDITGTLLATGNAFLRVGYLGVPLFMILSGLSLTIVALHRETAPVPVRRFLARRLRRVMLPYWASFAITVVFALTLAAVQWQRHGGDSYWRYLSNGDISVDGGQLTAGLLLLPRIFRDEWQFAPEGSLWFVLVIVQYYLLFPLLLNALRRIGPSLFLIATLAITLASLATMAAINGDLASHRGWIEMAAPFRIVECGAGMTLGYILVRGSAALSLLDTITGSGASIAAGVVLFIAGCLIDLDAGIVSALQWPAIVLGLTLIIAPLIASRPVVIERSTAGRALAWVGVVSYTVLILSEPLRSITHTMSAEDAPDLAIVAWVAFGLIPITLLLARPLAIALGLVERQVPVTTVGDLVGESAPVAVERR